MPWGRAGAEATDRWRRGEPGTRRLGSLVDNPSPRPGPSALAQLAQHRGPSHWGLPASQLHGCACPQRSYCFVCTQACHIASDG